MFILFSILAILVVISFWLLIARAGRNSEDEYQALLKKIGTKEKP